MFKSSTTLIYLLFIYIFLQFAWWTYLIIDLNLELISIQLNTEITENYANDWMQRKILMVIGEGSVFLIILFLGLRQVHNSVKRQLKLTKQQNNFLLSVTHEFNSPLASIKLFLETFLKRDLDKEKKEKFVKSALKETERLGQMVDNILMINKLDALSNSISVDAFNFSEFLEDYISKKKSIYGDAIFKKVAIESNVKAKFDKSAMEIVLNNLLENAIKYTKDSVLTLEIELLKLGTKFQFSLKDNGKGIVDKEKVFEKFYREEDELTRNTKGSGLGLYLVKHLLNHQNLNIQLHDNKPSGVVATITGHLVV